MYRKATDSCILISYPATLLNSFISSNSFGLEGFLYKVSCHLKIVTVLLLSFQFECFLFLFPCLTAVIRTSNTMLNRNCESGHPSLVLEFRGKAFSFSPLSTMLAVGLSEISLIPIPFEGTA